MKFQVVAILRVHFAAAALCVSLASAQTEAPGNFGPDEPPFRVPSHPIAITGGVLIDATGASPKLGYTLLVEDGRIKAVGPSESVVIPDDAIAASLRWGIHWSFSFVAGGPGAA